MRLIDYLVLLRQRLGVVLAVIAATAAVSLALASLQDPSYQANLRLQAVPVNPIGSAESAGQEIAGQGNLATEAQLVVSQSVAARVVEKLGIQARPSELLGSVIAFPLEGSAIIQVQATTADPQFSVNLANAFAEAYLEVRRAQAEDRFNQAIANINRQIEEARLAADAADAEARQAPPNSPQSVEAAARRDRAIAELVELQDTRQDLLATSVAQGFGEIIIPAESASPLREQSMGRSLVFGILLGLPLAVAAVLLLDSLNDAVRHRADAESLTGAEVLGVVPFDRTLAPVALSGLGARLKLMSGQLPDEPPPGPGGNVNAIAADVDPYSVVAEAYRTAALNLAIAATANSVNTVFVTSPYEADGKTTATSNLGVAHAELGQSALIVDADLRRPRTHEVFGVDAEPGLAELLQGDANARKVIQRLRPSLRFVGAGRGVERPDRLVASADLKGTFDELVKAVTPRTPRRSSSSKPSPKEPTTSPPPMVLLDGPPALQAAEALTLSRAAEGVVLVLRVGVSRRQAAADAAEQIRRAGGNLLGVVLVGATGSGGGSPAPEGSYSARLIAALNKLTSSDPDRYAQTRSS